MRFKYNYKIEDDDIQSNVYKTKSGSITTQRALLYDYIKHHKEFAGCGVIEKCDDVFFETHFDNRPQFAELIELAKKGKINCIIIKDFCGFGRDYVELGNYLEQIFLFMEIQFISVYDNYDSVDLLDGTTGGLDAVAGHYSMHTMELFFADSGHSRLIQFVRKFK